MLTVPLRVIYCVFRPAVPAQTPVLTSDEARRQALAASGNIPRHIACIMDGNGRWAKSKGLPRVAGHREGVVSVREITEACAELGVEYLTLYTFSTENWQRPRAEVSALMELLVRTLHKEVERLQKNKIRLTTIGDLERLPKRCADELREAEEQTADNNRMTLNLALSYSGRWEITQAARQLARQAKEGGIDPDTISEDDLAGFLHTHEIPDPDLLIRTGGNFRISNFLLWQLAYTEIYVTDRYWPAFRRDALYEAIEDFQHRERRFGRVSGPEDSAA